MRASAHEHVRGAMAVYFYGGKRDFYAKTGAHVGMGGRAQFTPPCPHFLVSG